MTKRRAKNALPTGYNKNLGKALTNRTDARHANVKGGPTVSVDVSKEVKIVQASVTHENDYAEFFTNAQLAGRDFSATKEDFKLMNNFEAMNVEEVQSKSYDHLLHKYGAQLRVPRRPPKTSYTNAAELVAAETHAFIEWKRDLAQLAEADGVVLTPFERNLELWRQLWRVLERSDLIVQIVDARNPLLFRSADLETYAREFDPPKRCVVLVNKADLLSARQVEQWHAFFAEQNLHAIFWSAMPPEAAAFDELTAMADQDESGAHETASSNSENARETDTYYTASERSTCSSPQPQHSTTLSSGHDGAPYIHNAEELLIEFKRLAFEAQPGRGSITVGMVGYPNVGKSSTINRIIGAKKTSVSATPGKTKHFQTLIVDDELTLCDCPGLVWPSFGFSAPEMLLNGVLPVDRMHDHFSPVHLLCTRVPRRVFESLYSLVLPKRADFEKEQNSTTAHDLLTTLAFARGFMTSSGVPDTSRAARIVLKDVFKGRLTWVAAPPGFDQSTFDSWTEKSAPVAGVAETLPPVVDRPSILQTQLHKRNYLIGANTTDRRVDESFFSAASAGAHVKPVKGRGLVVGDKKHHKGKKDKLRRLYGENDA